MTNQRTPPRPPLAGIHDAETLPEQQSVADAQTERDRQELVSKYPDARAIEIDQLVVARGTRRVADSALNQIGQVRKKQDEHEQRILVLETRPVQVSITPPPKAPTPRGPMQSYSDIDDGEAVSGSVLRAAMQKQNTDQRRATNTQTAAIIGALIALATAGAGWLNAQTERTRSDTAAAARTAATEAVREAAPVVKEAAREAVKESQKEDY